MNFLTTRNKLTRSLDSDRTENFIAFAMKVGYPGMPVYGRHVGILICIRGELKIFHWDEHSVLLEDLDQFKEAENVYHRIIKFLPTSNSLLDAMLARFRSIKDNTAVTYGIVAEPQAHYNENGVFVGLTGLPEICSCVGFCIYVIAGFLFKSKKFFEIDDWNTIPVESHEKLIEWYEKAKAIYPDLSEDEYRKNHRRILPNEFVLGGYATSSQIPVTKSFIDGLSPYFNPYVSGLSLIDLSLEADEEE